MPEETPPKPQKAKAFHLLASLAGFAREHGIPLTDPTLVDRFMADAAPRLKEALADPTLIHGSRTERLFEATVLSLGKFRMFKTEDAGRVHGAATSRAPDFRIVLDDGEQWLVEVKNVRCKEPFKQVTQMSAPYLASLQAYADMVGTPLKLAIYWSLWNIWTIVSPNRFRRPKGGLRMTIQDAVLANEFGRLGEVIIMTKAPLRLVLGAAPDMAASLSPEGMANFIIGSAKLYSGDAELVDPRDRKLAEVLLFYGEWPSEGPHAVTEDGAFAGVRAGTEWAGRAAYSVASMLLRRSRAIKSSSCMARRRRNGSRRSPTGTLQPAGCRCSSGSSRRRRASRQTARALRHQVQS